MKKIYSAIISAFFLFSVSLVSCFSQDAARQDVSLLDRMYSRMTDACVGMEYSYSTRMYGTKTIGSGILTVQGGYWMMKGNGLEMWCDATTVWIADVEAKEVVIENASADRSDRMANPALLFVNLSDSFKVQSSRAVNDGKSMLYVLVPTVGCDIGYCNIEIRKSDASITKGSFIMTDGNVIDIIVSSMEFHPLRPAEDFRPSISFDSSWIVTDLR